MGDAEFVCIPEPDTSDVDSIVQLSSDIESMEDLAAQLESGNFSADLAFEADCMVPQAGLLNTYYGYNSNSERIRVGSESLVKNIWDTVLKIMEHIGNMIKKAIQWLIGLFNRKGFSGTTEQITAAQKIIGDQELSRAIDSGFAEAKGVNLGTEDYFPSGNLNTIASIYSSYQASLSDAEIDFLTSGTHYKRTRDAVSDFTGANLAEFIRDYERDLFKWGQTGLEKAIHTGNGEDPTTSFGAEQTKLLRALQEQYERPIRIIREMSEQYLKQSDPVHRERLKIFMREPSKLYPHLEHLWSEIHFERISTEDRKIIHTLEEVEKNHEQLVTKFQAYAKANQKPWAPEEEMLKLISKAHQESMVVIGKLVKVAGYIKSASAIAYSASTKSLSYIIRVLNEISKLPNVNRDKVMKSIDIVISRRVKLIDVAKIAN